MRFQKNVRIRVDMASVCGDDIRYTTVFEITKLHQLLYSINNP